MLGAVSTPHSAEGRRPTATLPADDRFAVHVLGAFWVARGETPLAPREIGSHQGRTLLKLLLVQRGHLVATDRIAEVLWGEQPPTKWERALAVLVSRLRGVFGAESIEGGREGYRFIPSERTSIDLDEAERLTEESEARIAAREPSLARAAADRALELLGRGPLLEDEPYADWAEDARAGAGALLRRAQRAAWRAAMALSDYEAAAAVAESAVRADPIDEEAARASMQALFLGGERGRALAAYDRLREALSESLGADPAPETARLHVAMLREEPLPQLQPGPSVARGPLDPGFVGREAELAEVSRYWIEAVAGEPALVLLAGEAGIGKTRLAAEAIRLAEHTGGVVVQARCYEAERSLFLEPIVDALRAVVVSTPPDAVRALAGDDAATLGELVPEVRSILRPMPVERGSPDIERRRAFDAVAGFVRGMSLRRPVLLFLDDLHNAGTSTLELLHFLLRRAAGGRLLVMATLRLEEGDEAVAHLGDLAHTIGVGPLSADAVSELARRMGVPELSERILARTGGHSLFVMETLRAISEGTPAEGDTPVPESLRDAVLARVGRAGPDVEEFLRMGAVLGSAFDLVTVTDLLEVPLEESARRSDRAVRARLLNEAGPVFEFANDLIREILYRTTPQPVLTARHTRAAALLRDNPEAVGVHASAAGDLRTAMEAWLLAAERSAGLANRDAELMLHRAVDAARTLEDQSAEARGLLARGRVREALGHYEGAFHDHTRGLELVRGIGDRALEMEFLREIGGDVMIGMGRRALACIPYLEAALAIAEERDDGEAVASILSRLAIIDTNRLQFEGGGEHARRALTIARALGEERALALALDGLKTVAAYGGDLATLESVTSELEVILRRRFERYFLEWNVFESSFLSLAGAKWDTAVRRIEEALALNLRSGHLRYRPMFLAHIGWIHRSRGDYGRALTVGRESVELPYVPDHPWWTSFALAMYGWTLTELGALDEAIPQLERGLMAAERDGAESYVVRCLSHLALATWLGGQRDRTEGLLGRAVEILEGVRSGDGPSFLHGAHAYAAAARTLIELGRLEDAERLLAPVLATAGPVGWREAAAESAMLVGRARLLAGDLGGAGSLLERALDGARDPALPRVAWETHAHLADASAAAGADDRAAEHRAKARSIARTIANSVEDDELRARFVAAARRRLRAPRR
jgi:DNA-binding SARP family transcriptional activator